MKKKNFIIKLLYPQRCKYCNIVIDIRREICHTCENTLQKIEGDICKLCGKKVNDCNCGHKKHFYKYICAPFYYDGAASRAIWRFKFRNQTKLSKVFAEDMANCFDTYYKGYDFDLCTFVPSSKESLKERGYNQAELLARDFSEITDIPCEEVLLKTRETKIQHDLLSVERSGNLAGAIELKDGIDLENKRILLIDDIKTTGSTLNECAKMLWLNGAKDVYCISVALTKQNKKRR